jgi:hypothetical protein
MQCSCASWFGFALTTFFSYAHFTTQVVQRARNACAQQIGRRNCVNVIIGAKSIEVFNIRKDGYVERTGLQPFEWNADNVGFKVLIACCSGNLFEMCFIGTTVLQSSGSTAY